MIINKKSIENFGELLITDISGFCNDGRKIPLDISKEDFVQLNVFEWKKQSPHSGLIFSYNSFLIHPISTRSVLNSIDPNEELYSHKVHKKSHWYLPRVFDQEKKNLDPINNEGLIVFDSELEDRELYFQHNSIINDNYAYLIKTTPAKFKEYLSKSHKVFTGNIEQKLNQ